MKINKHIRNVLFGFLAIGTLFIQACNKGPEIIPSFEGAGQPSIYEFLLENEEEFSSFLSILKSSELEFTLSAYNPDGNGYTLFLPDNEAITEFINKSEKYSSLDDILDDVDYAAAFARYHIVNSSIPSKDFPFGAFSRPTLSSDYLTVSFITENDSAYYKINGQSTVIQSNIEMSNGYIHLIESALVPVTYTSYQWLEQQAEFSIFKQAVDLTGLQSKIDFNSKDDVSFDAITMLLEHDSIYIKNGINSITDLAQLISPDDKNYTDSKNLLYNFVAYHFLIGNYFIDDFEGKAENYNTHSDIPLNINGIGIEFAINKGKQVFDTLVYLSDTTYIDFIGFVYDKSNVLTQSGAVHFVDRLMKQQTPSRSTRTFQFTNQEPYLESLSKEAGIYILENQEELIHLNWSGTDLYYVEMGSEQIPAWNNDYLYLNGDFEISYEMPKIIQGKYNFILRAHAFARSNAMVEVFVDGKKMGGLVDLSKGGTSNLPFQNISLGIVNFSKYESHIIEVKSVIPGRFLWDAVRFEP